MNLIMGWYLCSLMGQLCESSIGQFTKLALRLLRGSKGNKQAVFEKKPWNERGCDCG